MTGDELRKSILAAAVRGALCPQDETDEPASALLARIREEKKKLVQEGKRKKEKNPTEIVRGTDGHFYERGNGKETDITDDLPFEIPDSWEWVRLGDLVYNHGQKKPTEEFCYIDIGSIDNKRQKLSENETIVAPEKAASRARKIVQKGDVLYATVRPYLHNVCIVDREFSREPIASTGFAVLTCHGEYLNQFLFHYLLSPAFDTYANASENARGVAYPAINDERLYKAFVPVPPLAEQKRIVERLETLRPLIAEYTRIETEETARRKALPDDIKKSVLAHAVRGALCPQDETDEPAAALLSRIREEKKKLIQEGKRKKEKNPTEIHRGPDGRFYETTNGNQTDITDVLPFEIPDSWEWVRLGDIFKIEMGQSPDGDSVTENPGGMEFHQGKVFFGEQYLRESGKFTSAPTKIAPADSVLLCVRAPVGKVNITEREICIGRGLCAISPLAGMPLLFVYYSLLAYENIFVKQATGTTFVAITADVVKKQLFPVPPLAEQKRIAARLTQILSALEELKGQN